ncbi:hypothetical protein BJ165DRAFT_1530825 [Panaeolus papilionaceus]|nr:hypothetical protein BJ165DRAFT_1530825 [Panaeolus papilionaceus]
MAKRSRSDSRSTSTTPSPEPAQKKAKKRQEAAKNTAEDEVQSGNSDEEVDQLLNDEDEPEDEDSVGKVTNKNRSDVVHIRKSIKAYASYVNKKRSGTTELRIAPDGCVYLSKFRYAPVVEKDRCTNPGCMAQPYCYKRVNHKQNNQACASCAMRGRTCKSTSSSKVKFVDSSMTKNTSDGAASQTGAINDLLAAFQDFHDKTNGLLQTITKQGESLLALQSAVLGIPPETLSDPCEFNEALRRIRKSAQQTTQEEDEHKTTQESGHADVVVSHADGGPLEDRQQIFPSAPDSQLASISQPASQLLIGTGHLKRKTPNNRKPLNN